MIANLMKNANTTYIYIINSLYAATRMKYRKLIDATVRNDKY